MSVEHRAWTDAHTRAALLGAQDGVPVLASDPALRWIGTFATIGLAGQTSNGFTSRRVWNARHRVRAQLSAKEFTASWVAVGDNSWRPLRAPNVNTVSIVSGRVQAGRGAVMVKATASAGSPSCAVGIGVDSDTEPADDDGVVRSAEVSSGTYSFPHAAQNLVLAEGLSIVQPLQKASSNAVSFRGSDGY